MSIKSWIDSVAKKRKEKIIKREIEYYKKLNIRAIRLDEDLNLYHIYNDGTTNKSEALTDIHRFKSLSREENKKRFYDSIVETCDKIFGPHQQCVENGKNILVWDVK